MTRTAKERARVAAADAAGARRRRSARPVVLVAGLLLLGALGTLGYRWWAESHKAAAERRDLLSRVDTEVNKDPVDAGQMSQLVAQLKKLPDHESARDLRQARARIELARDRPDLALSIFGGDATGPGAAPAEQGFGAEILLRVHELGTGDAATAKGMLLQALAAAEAAAAESQSVTDTFHAWLAATRVDDAAAAARYAATLKDRHGDSAAARFVALKATFDPKTDGARIDDLVSEFRRPPVELEAMRILVVVERGDLDAAVAAIDVLLARASGVASVRFAGSLVFLACAMTHPESSVERATWIRRRDAQLDWLSSRTDADDPRRAAWETMRQRR